MRTLITCSLLLLLLSSCYKDVDNSDIIEIITEQPRTDMETGLMGHVDESTLLPISDYEIKIDEITYYVPGSHFYFHVDDLNKQGQLIEVFKDERLVSVAYTYLIENDINSLELISLPSSVSSTTSDGSLTIDNDISVKVDLNDLRTSAGNSTNGEVTASHIVIEDKELLSQFGSSAYTKEGELRVLNPDMGFIINYNNSNNNLLLTDQAETTLEISSYQGKDLYVYHKTFEYWIEVGTIGASALKTDQLGYFLIASSEPGIYSEGTVKNGDEVISYLHGSHDLEEWSFPFISSEKGKWAQVLPEERGLETSYYDPCKELIGTYEIATSAVSNTKHESQIVNEKVFRLTTEVVDCEGNNLSNPSIAISQEQANEAVYVFSGSATDRNLVVCNPEFAVAGYDLSNADKGPQIPWTLSTEDQLKYISNCELYADGYSYVKINGVHKVYPHFNYLATTDETRFFTSNSTFEIKIKGNDKNLYGAEDINIFIADGSFGDEGGYHISCLNSENGCGISELRVTHINEGGNGWIRASFKGVLWMRAGMDNPVAGYYPIEGVIVIKQ